MNSSQLE